jgi:NAD(P)-dependent dehydrogenase (short-subunit alcohol dehydrogenase family)
MNTPLIFQQISGQYQNAEEMVKARDAACPMGRMGTAWNIAKAALFLASDDAEYITGVQLSGRRRPDVPHRKLRESATVKSRSQCLS